MDIVLNAVEIIDSRSSLNGKKRNVHIKNGVIEAITTRKISGGKQYDTKGMLLSIGWIDLGAHFSDPGFEHKESLQSGRNLAMQSGFTGVAILPNTHPVVQSKNEISYLTNKNAGELTQILALAAVTSKNAGKELTEMIDLHHAGAVGFTDGLNPIWHTDIMLKSLQYLQKFEGLLINKPEDKMLTNFGSMHEGTVSTYLGLKGMPSLSEELVVQRDIKLLAYAGGRLHFHNISTAGSVDLIRKAKKDGLAVTCDVAIHQLKFDDSYLVEYDTNYKVNPPLRSKKDIAAMKKGIKDGTIDLIVSAHIPQDEESKNLEFDLADFGIINLQTFLPSLLESCQDIELQLLLETITVNPRNLLNLPLPSIEVGQKADLTLFDPNHSWQYTFENNLSQSKNSPLFGSEMVGKTMAVFGNSLYYMDQTLGK